MSWRDEGAAFARFFAAPRRTPAERRAGAPWIARLLVISALTIAIALALDAALVPLAERVGVHSALPERVTPEWLFSALIFAPIVEELLFRAGLRQAVYTLAIGPALLILMFAPWTPATFSAAAVWLALALVVNRVLVARVFRVPGRRHACGRRYVRHFGWVFWTYTLTFALMHMSNYSADGAARAALPLLVLPQLLIGAVLGYLRLRDGLRSSVLMHFLVNAAASAGMAINAG